ncbi:MAG: hypothetical protein GC161_17380 [Planctomycetaceae bacterium]|nr:hypothetical protein [Planctomycetaceae bacterium]
MNTEPGNDARERARAWLVANGLAVELQRVTWWECWIHGPGTDAVGRGATPEAAFDGALAALLPNRLVRDLFERALAAPGESSRPQDVESAAPPVEESVERPAKPAPESFAALPAVPADALEELESLEAELDAAELELLLDAPESMRWQLAALMGTARAIEARADHPVVTARVRRIAKRLGVWSRLAWPGFVPVLALDCTPQAAGDWLGVAGAERWDHVAAGARALLAAVPGDGGGWSDDAALEPPPPNPAWSLERVLKLLEKRLGAAEPGSDELREAAKRWHGHGNAMTGFVRAARELRWLRQVAPAPLEWASAMGRLRWLAQEWRLGPGEALSVALDPAFAPRPNWAHELGRDPRTLERERRRREVLRLRPSRATNDRALLDWFARAAEVFDAPELAPHCAEVAPRILALDPTEVFPAGSARERLKRVQRRLVEPVPAAAVATQPALDPDVELEPEPPAPTEPGPVERAKARVAGRRALVVANREDPHLSRRYADDLGLAVDWCDASQGARTVDAACERIAARQYDLVLFHTGFLSHSTDGKVKQSCRASATPYVPVYKGRILATALALLSHAPA